MPSKIKIVERKLGRENCIGLYDEDNSKIELEIRLKSKERLLVLIHELLHHCFKNLSEKEVLKYEKIIGNALWEDGYRRIK